MGTHETFDVSTGILTFSLSVSSGQVRDNTLKTDGTLSNLTKLIAIFHSCALLSIENQIEMFFG